jgi:ABC-2 type transport system permease protein/oleandomycin transport system permease protein
LSAVVSPSLATTVSWTASDILAMTWRNLIRYIRIPQLLIFSSIQPVMFVLLFNYVFGGAIKVPNLSYTDYLMPGIFVQTAVFGATQTGIGLAEDLSKGMIDRFRSLPMARSAVLAGRTLSDTVRNAFVVLLMSGVGFVIGFRIHNGWLHALLALAIIMGFSVAFTWVSAVIGLLVRDVETAQVAGFIWIFPLTFASSAFVPVAGMPSWLQEFATRNPITLTVNAARSLILGGDVSPWPAVAWIIGILVVFVPLSVRMYRRVT